MKKGFSKRFMYVFVMSIMLTAFLTGCSSNDKNESEKTATETVAPAADNNTADNGGNDVLTTDNQIEQVETASPVPEGMVKSTLTGKYVDEKIAKKRPYAVMINNIEYAARFHSGLSKASIIYEAKVEGGITRLMALFEDVSKLKKIGPIRSARHYFVSVASEYDAIFVHFGHTKFALKKIDKLGVDNLSGLSGYGGMVFYRDKNIKAPHNAFTSKKGLEAGLKRLKYRKNHKKDYQGHFQFYDQDTDLAEGKDANKVSIKFSGYASPYFKYNAEKKLYYRYQYGKKHMDTANNKQLSFKNIIIQFVDDEPIVKGHPKDYRTINFEKASGKGRYITNGKSIKIRWEKNEKTGYMKYFNEDGSELVINPGKTYVALYPDEGSALKISAGI